VGLFQGFGEAVCAALSTSAACYDPGTSGLVGLSLVAMVGFAAVMLSVRPRI
jgi:hypothetical protein